MAEAIGTAVDFLKKVRGEEFVKVKFTKKNGEERIMKCTLNFKKIPKRNWPKTVDLPNILGLLKKGLLRVFDLEKKEWRTIPFQRTDWLEIPTKERFSIRK